MHALNMIMMYPLKKRKRGVLTALCGAILLYVGVQVMYFRDNYSPLQLLSSVEGEATRLLKLMSQIQVQCNNTLPAYNVSNWVLCLDPEIGFDLSTTEENLHRIVYSIGPRPDFSFEQLVGRNLSQHLFIFSPPQDHINLLNSISNTTRLFTFNVVPNDPADFARNSFGTQTINSVLESLKHKEIDILKVDTLMETVEAYELLRFLISDSVLLKVKELHIALKLDRVEGDFIYSWYRVLYLLFHTAGFRLYYIAASDPLCLQDTIMESCTYYLSWIHKPPAHVFVMYPPAIDGSAHNEEDRLLDFLENSASIELHLYSLMLELVSTTLLANTQSEISFAQKVITKNAQPCSIVIILEEQFKNLLYAKSSSSRCDVFTFVQISQAGTNTPVFLQLPSQPQKKNQNRRILQISDLQKIFTSSSTNILYIESSDVWQALSMLSSQSIPKILDEVIIRDHIFHTHGSSRIQPATLRRRYSELQRLKEFGLTLVDCHKLTADTMTYNQGLDTYRLHYVKKSLL